MTSKPIYAFIITGKRDLEDELRLVVKTDKKNMLIIKSGTKAGKAIGRLLKKYRPLQHK